MWCPGAAAVRVGGTAAGGHALLDDDPVVAAAGRSAGRAGRDASGDGIHVGLLETCVFYLLEAHGFDTWLAKDVKHLPGRGEDGQAGRGVVVQGPELSTMARMDAITADIARVHDKIEELITPFRPRGGTTR